MNKSKVIGILTAVLGVAVSFSAAFALYVKEAQNTGFGIGSATHTSSTAHADYKINGKSNPTVDPEYYTVNGTNGGTKLDGEYRHVKYTFSLGASYASDTQAQKYIVGDLGVTLTNINDALLSKAKVSMYFVGYNDNTVGKNTYGGNMTTGESVAINEYTLTASSLSVNTKEMAVSTDGTQKLVIYFDLDAVDTLEADELDNLWTLNVSWGQSSSFVAAYMVNDQVLWGDDDEFVMTPDINAASWKWVGVIKGSETLTQAKVRKGDVWSAGENASLDAGTVYDVEWYESGENTATFEARTPNLGA